MRTSWLVGTRSITTLKLSIFTTALIAATLVPMLASPVTTHADTACSPLGIQPNGNGYQWLSGGVGVNVCYNGTDPSQDAGGTTPSCVPVSSSSSDSHCSVHNAYAGEEWQCVELVNRLYLTQGWTTATWTGNGNTLIDHVPSGLVEQDAGHISYVNPGDVITFNNSLIPAGHAAIINTIDSNGTLHIINQNTSASNMTSSATLNSGTSFSGGNANFTSSWSGYSVQAVIHAPTRMMVIDGSSHAYSEDFLGNSWTTQLNTATVSAIAVGGSGRMMVMTSSGEVYGKNYPTDSWTTEISSGAKAIAVGGGGDMMVIDSAGNVSAKVGLTDSWTQEYGSGGAKAIAVGGNGVEMIIDSSGNAWSNTGFNTSWGNEVTGAQAIAVGGNGRMMVINSAGNAYAEDGPGSWTAETGSGGTKAIAVGGNGRMMVIDSSSNAYYRDALTTGSWTSELGGSVASAIAVGSNGRMMVIDTSGEAWGKDQPSDNWTSLTCTTRLRPLRPCGNPR